MYCVYRPWLCIRRDEPHLLLSLRWASGMMRTHYLLERLVSVWIVRWTMLFRAVAAMADKMDDRPVILIGLLRRSFIGRTAVRFFLRCWFVRQSAWCYDFGFQRAMYHGAWIDGMWFGLVVSGNTSAWLHAKLAEIQWATKGPYYSWYTDMSSIPREISWVKWVPASCSATTFGKFSHVNQRPILINCSWFVAVFGTSHHSTECQPNQWYAIFGGSL